jgi:flavorubredoxin
MAKVLIVYHSLSGNTKKAAELVAEGVRQVKGCEAVVKQASEAGIEELLGCQAIAIGTPDYFSYMAGMVKDFFDRTFYPTQGQVSNKPCGIFVTHGGGGKAVQSVKDVCRSFKFRTVAEPVLVRNAPDAKAAEQLRTLGEQLAGAAASA